MSFTAKINPRKKCFTRNRERKYSLWSQPRNFLPTKISLFKVNQNRLLRIVPRCDKCFCHEEGIVAERRSFVLLIFAFTAHFVNYQYFGNLISGNVYPKWRPLNSCNCVLTILSSQYFLFSPENIIKPLIFWYIKEGQKVTLQKKSRSIIIIYYYYYYYYYYYWANKQ